MYYLKKIVELLLLLAIIWLSVENYSVKVNGITIFGNEIMQTSVIFVIFASLIIGGLISAFFSAIKEWKTVRGNRKTISELKDRIKDMEIKTKDLQITQNDLEKLKIENAALKSEVKTLKEVISPSQTSLNKQVEY